MQETKTEVQVTDGIRLNVTIWEADPAATGGERRCALLLHGWPNSGLVWREFAAALILADPDWRLYAPDQRGYGLSDKPAEGYHAAALAADAVAASASLFGEKPWALIAHSMGGKIAQIAAAQQPAGLRHLVLLAPSPLKTEPLPEANKDELSAACGDSVGIRRFVESLPAHTLSDTQMQSLIDDGLAVPPAAWDGWVRTMRDEDFGDFAATITTPTLVVAGGRDKRAPREILQLGVADRIAGARLEVLPGSGHLPHLEEPNALAALVVNFLDGSLPPQGGG